MIWYITSDVGLSSKLKQPGVGEFRTIDGQELENGLEVYGLVSAGNGPLFSVRH